MSIRKNNFLGFCFIAPCVVLIAVFSYYPFIDAFRLSLYTTNGIREPVFVGLNNFIALFTDTVFLKSFIVLGKFIIVSLPLCVFCPLLGAKMLFNIRSSRLSYFFRVLFVIPMVVPGMVGILIWKEFYNTDGVINSLLRLIGLGGFVHSWLGDVSTALYSIIFTGVPWIGGATLLIYLAGYMNISKSLYETAEIEGLGWFYILFKIEIPLLFPQIRLTVVLALLGLIQTYDNILVFTNGGPMNTTLTPALYLFKNAFEYQRLGYATAIGVVLFIISLVLSYINFKVIKKRTA